MDSSGIRLVRNVASNNKTSLNISAVFFFLKKRISKIKKKSWMITNSQALISIKYNLNHF